jgi:hypothetical protein
MDGLIIRFHDTLPETADGANRLHTQTGHTIVTETYLNAHTADQLLADIKKSGDLYLHGHGEPKALGGKSPIAMAKFLADQGLTGPVVVHLYACNGGTGGAPYALELKVALVQGHKIMCSVDGAKGFLDLANGNWSIAKNLSDPVGSGPALNAAGSQYKTTRAF